MPYFPVDDQLHSHPKAVMAGNAAMGLWVRAGSWCKNHATGGAIPTAIAESFGTKSQAKQLVTVGLWEKTPTGFQFHDWQEQAGNLDSEGELRQRAQAKERKERWKRKQADEKAAREAAERNGDAFGTRSGGVPDASGTTLPSPSPSPSNPVNNSSPVPETEARAGTDEESVEEVCSRQLKNLGVDYAKVRTARGTHAGRIFPPTDVVRVAATILGRAAGTPNSPTGFVITAIRNDWAEWQKFLDNGAVG